MNKGNECFNIPTTYMLCLVKPEMPLKGKGIFIFNERHIFFPRLILFLINLYFSLLLILDSYVDQLLAPLVKQMVIHTLLKKFYYTEKRGFKNWNEFETLFRVCSVHEPSLSTVITPFFPVYKNKSQTVPLTLHG